MPKAFLPFQAALSVGAEGSCLQIPEVFPPEVRIPEIQSANDVRVHKRFHTGNSFSSIIWPPFLPDKTGVNADPGFPLPQDFRISDKRYAPQMLLCAVRKTENSRPHFQEAGISSLSPTPSLLRHLSRRIPMPVPFLFGECYPRIRQCCLRGNTAATAISCHESLISTSEHRWPS